MKSIPNKQIVDELRAGRREGCGHLVELYRARLVREATAVFRVPRADAEELVNDILLAVIEKIGSFEFRHGDGDFHFWIMTIFRNRVRDYFRRASRSSNLFVPLDADRCRDGEGREGLNRDVEAAILRDYQTAEDATAPSEALQIVGEVLDALAPWERVLLRCRALDVPYDEIARYTGKPAAHLKVYHKRVQNKFASLLNAKYRPAAVREHAEEQVP